MCARVLLVGCGALGSVSANQLVRAGVGELILVDRDIVEEHNLHRQLLYTEEDCGRGLPKAIAAERHLKDANSQVKIKGVVADLNFSNCLNLVRGVDLIIDGTDNFETRQLLNDLALEKGIPWLYGGAIGSRGMIKAVIPGQSSCFRCLMGDVPGAGEAPTCETDGVLASTTGVVASLQVSLALQILTGRKVIGDLFFIDVWDMSMRKVSAPPLDDCPACIRGERPFLLGQRAGDAIVLCGHETVQVLPTSEKPLDLDLMADKLRSLGAVENRKFYISFDDGSLVLTIFPDGRCHVKGTDDKARARAAVARYLGG